MGKAEPRDGTRLRVPGVWCSVQAPPPQFCTEDSPGPWVGNSGYCRMSEFFTLWLFPSQISRWLWWTQPIDHAALHAGAVPADDLELEQP